MQSSSILRCNLSHSSEVLGFKEGLTFCILLFFSLPSVLLNAIFIVWNANLVLGCHVTASFEPFLCSASKSSPLVAFDFCNYCLFCFCFFLEYSPPSIVIACAMCLWGHRKSLTLNTKILSAFGKLQSKEHGEFASSHPRNMMTLMLMGWLVLQGFLRFADWIPTLRDWTFNHVFSSPWKCMLLQYRQYHRLTPLFLKQQEEWNLEGAASLPVKCTHCNPEVQGHFLNFLTSWPRITLSCPSTDFDVKDIHPSPARCNAGV